MSEIIPIDDIGIQSPLEYLLRLFSQSARPLGITQGSRECGESWRLIHHLQVPGPSGSMIESSMYSVQSTGHGNIERISR
jgi:hypothetical protein